jgi:hypothetical protein
MTKLPTTIDPVTAAGMLQYWGFLAQADVSGQEGPSFLLVAMRPSPTLLHYDPERVDYWVTEHGQGLPASLDRMCPMPVDAETTWGMIRVVDRLGVTNEWLSFGGRLAAAKVDGSAVAVFTSSAPLLRRGGHSQGWDKAAPSVAAFFAKVRAAAGADHRFEVLEGAADPLARYSCFVGDFARRYRRSEVLKNLDPELWRVVSHEERRMRDRYPQAWKTGSQLLDELDNASTDRSMGNGMTHP